MCMCMQVCVCVCVCADESIRMLVLFIIYLTTYLEWFNPILE